MCRRCMSGSSGSVSRCSGGGGAVGVSSEVGHGGRGGIRGEGWVVGAAVVVGALGGGGGGGGGWVGGKARSRVSILAADTGKELCVRFRRTTRRASVLLAAIARARRACVSCGLLRSHLNEFKESLTMFVKRKGSARLLMLCV